MVFVATDDDDQFLMEEEQRSKSSCISVVVPKKWIPEYTAADWLLHDIVGGRTQQKIYKKVGITIQRTQTMMLERWNDQKVKSDRATSIYVQ